ncbi:coiled-coil domain-containing protein 12 [Arctopsyche grandis]|uniref:coiled-coil domain-containing protein 12 n=1 Tax=Arctopsyche grandis TaxID=121162 RepID=UPI00406D9686
MSATVSAEPVMVVKEVEEGGGGPPNGERKKAGGFRGPGGKLEEEALKRRERLRALRERRTAASENQNGDTMDSLPAPIFRNYKPLDDDLKECVLPEAPVGDVTSEIKDQLEAANVKVVIEELDITNLAPRKPDWDLKRDVSKKLEKLERRTQKAIAELIWERLKEGQNDNINAMVTLAVTDQNDKKS